MVRRKPKQVQPMAAHRSAIAEEPLQNLWQAVLGGLLPAQAARGRQCIFRPWLNCRVARMQMLASTPSAPPICRPARARVSGNVSTWSCCHAAPAAFPPACGRSLLRANTAHPDDQSLSAGLAEARTCAVPLHLASPHATPLQCASGGSAWQGIARPSACTAL